MALSAGQRVGSYEIIRKLGAGGMGEVYCARDTRLRRLVALKILTGDDAAGPERSRRFLREAQLASALNHPNIVTIYEIGKADDIDFIAMEYADGETLATRMRGEALPEEECRSLALQIAEALAAAHEAGITHRDLKPANIMVSSRGKVKVLDFGLAKMRAPAGDDTTQSLLTRSGTVTGTPAYMAPEQAVGAEADERADVFAFGAVLFEMLTGRRAFQRSVAIEAAPAFRQPLSALELVAARCLERNPAHRYPGGGALRLALKETITEQRPAASIAVLPFVDMSEHRDQEYLCDGIVEEIINSLAQMENLRVASRTSSFRFKGAAEDISEIGRRLRVGAVLEGSVRKAGERLRVTAQLVNAADGYHLWSERFDRKMEDVFDIEDEIARAVADRLKVKLIGDSSQPQNSRTTRNLEAYDIYLKGRYHLHTFTRQGIGKSIECFEQARRLDPDYAEPCAGLALSYFILGFLGGCPPRETMPRARAEAIKALQLSEAVAEAHLALGTVHFYYDWNWDAAEVEFRKAEELGPPDPSMGHFRSELAGCCGRMEESLAEAHRLVSLDPVSVEYNRHLAHMSYLARRWDNVFEYAQKALQLNPDYYAPWCYLGYAYAETGEYHHAIDSLKKAAKLSGSGPLAAASLGWCYGAAGKTAEAERVLAHMEDQRSRGYFPAAAMALVYTGMDEPERAVDLLEEAYHDRDGWLVFLKQDPLFDPLRENARFRQLLQKINFP